MIELVDYILPEKKRKYFMALASQAHEKKQYLADAEEYDSDIHDIVALNYFASGNTVPESLATEFCITPSEFEDWVRQHPSLLSAMFEGIDLALLTYQDAYNAFLSNFEGLPIQKSKLDLIQGCIKRLREERAMLKEYTVKVKTTLARTAPKAGDDEEIDVDAILGG